MLDPLLVAAASALFPELLELPAVPDHIGTPLRAALDTVTGTAPFERWPSAERLSLLQRMLSGGDATRREAVERFGRWVAAVVLEQPGVLDRVGFRVLAPERDWPDVDDSLFATTPADQLEPDYQVVIVGSGAGAGVAAHVLSRAGLHCLVIERAPALTTRQMASTHGASARTFSGFDRLVDLPALNAPRMVNGELTVPGTSQWNGNAMTLGGGTRVYGAMAWRFSPEDFAMGSVYGDPFVDWPIGYDDLAPFYDRVERVIGVAGATGLAPHDGPRSRAYPMPGVRLNSVGHRLATGADTLGLPTVTPPLAINTRAYNGRPACVECALCVGHACPANAKNGTHNTVLPSAVATGRCTVTTSAVVTSLIVAGNAVTGVAFVADGRQRLVRARHVVLAAGAIESARLLLASAVDDPHDQIGRYLQGHLYAGATGLFADPVDDMVGPGPSIATTLYRHGNTGVAGGGILANDFTRTPFEAWGGLVEAGFVSAYGSTAIDELAFAYPRSAVVIGPVQEAPQAESRVTVSGHLRDRVGVPLVHLDSPGPHPNDLAVAALLTEKAQNWLSASGSAKTVATQWMPRRGPSADQHQAGTCRMGTDPATSVTDANGALWNHRGLTIADGSLHPTNGGVNPVLTIMANAWRVSERLADSLT
ncbi:glucose-methanol-choline oxidoreductase [Mycolicibacterium canariasense]|uniref:Glucose-methanol-choline oxidoreductase n=2 Tax=Mycolicibacterium canariasense TaxID=228230 RepID=A0A117IBQ1_MYCCR|nr:glucose-methanol-choline oxidoreductase [Mycolicibacterium canariasense]